MNVSIYIFGEFDNGYNQYPDDTTSTIFRAFYKRSTSIGQLCIHRAGNLMYYGYIRKLEHNKYIGLGLILNDTMLTGFDKVFSMFEQVITYLITNGYLIQFNEQGEIVTNVENLYLDKAKIDSVENEIKNGLNRIDAFSAKLPPVDFTVSKDSIKQLTIDDADSVIVEAGYTYGYTIISKEKGNNTPLLNSYKGVLVKANKEKKELEGRYKELKEEYDKTLKQKKQYRVVVILFIILLLCCFGLYAVFDNLNMTQQDLSKAHTLIRQQVDTISHKQSIISQLRNDVDYLEQKYREEYSQRVDLQKELDTINSNIGKRQSYVITKSSFNFTSGYYDFSVFSVKSEQVTFTIKAFSPDGKIYENTESRYVSKGDNSFSIYLNKRLNSSKWHSFVVYVGNVVIGGGRH